MDKEFWLAVQENEYAVPDGYSAAELTEELFTYIGSLDPMLRDGIGYETFANWLAKGKYSPEQLNGYVTRLVLGLQDGLGERDTDTVFARTFSALFLAEIIHHDNKKAVLDKESVLSVYARAVAYLAEEKDARGFVSGKGWAHSLAHTADLLYVLSSNRFLAREELERILYAVTEKLTGPTDWVYIYNEEDRLVQVVLGAVQRNLLDEFFYKEWLKSFIFSGGVKRPWKRSFEQQEMHNAYFNTRNFLRSMYLRIQQAEKLLNRDFLLAETQSTLQALKQF